MKPILIMICHIWTSGFNLYNLLLEEIKFSIFGKYFGGFGYVLVLYLYRCKIPQFNNYLFFLIRQILYSYSLKFFLLELSFGNWLFYILSQICAR